MQEKSFGTGRIVRSRRGGNSGRRRKKVRRAPWELAQAVTIIAREVAAELGVPQTCWGLSTRRRRNMAGGELMSMANVGIRNIHASSSGANEEDDGNGLGGEQK